MATGVIYVHRNQINGKCYVGQTIKANPNARWQNGSGYAKQQKFYQAIQKYGWDNFDHIILEKNVPQPLLSARENYYITLYDSIDNGYNVEFAGNYEPMSEETKQKIRDSWTPERRAIQSARLKAQWESDPAFRERMREQAKQIPKRDMSGENNPMYGSHRVGKDAARKCAVECIETGDKFNTVKEAAEWLGSISQKSHISEVCKGKRNWCGKHPVTKQPLHWRYV